MFHQKLLESSCRNFNFKAVFAAFSPRLLPLPLRAMLSAHNAFIFQKALVRCTGGMSDIKTGIYIWFHPPYLCRWFHCTFHLNLQMNFVSKGSFDLTDSVKYPSCNERRSCFHTLLIYVMCGFMYNHTFFLFLEWAGVSLELITIF